MTDGSGSGDLMVRDSVRITPESFGMTRASVDHLQGGSAADNAHILKSILSGETGPRRDVVVLNSAFALHVSGRCGPLEECLEAARESIDSGAAQRRLDILIASSNEAASEHAQ